MEVQQIKDIVMRELPGIMQRDPEVQNLILRLSRQHYADKHETESRFDRVLAELQRDREEQTRKWEEQNRKWEEQNRKWEEQNRKWEENSARQDQILAALQAQTRKHDSSIGALGARWGIRTEQAFRSALTAILKLSFDMKVLNINEYDHAGEVFGRPDQVELDVIIQDGVVIVCEIKSSMSKSDVYIFERKVRYYEKHHACRVSRALVISPMIEPAAQDVAVQLGLETYTHAEDVPLTGGARP